MKKRFFSLLVCTALLLSIVCSAHTAWADSSSDDGGIYTDPETGATFVVPVGWEVDTFNLEEAASYYQIKYISQKNSGSSFLYGSADLWSTMSESRRSGHTRSQIDSAYIYEEWSSIESLVNLALETGITIDPADVHLITYGKNEFIEIPEIQEMAGIRIESSLFWYVENGYVYTFTFLGTSDQATEDFNIVLSSFQLSSPERSDLASDGTYTDSLSGLTFILPDGWNEVQWEMEFVYPFQVQFTSQQNAGSSLLYGSVDAWKELTASERSGHTRSDIDTAYIYAYEDGALIEYMAENIVQGAADVQSNAEVDDIGLVTYGKNEVIEISILQEIFGVRVPLTAILYAENGYMHLFLFGGSGEQAIRDFHAVLSSLQTPAAEASDSDSTGSGGTGSEQPDDLSERIMEHLVNFLLFLFELVVTFLIYALPFVIYRNVIRKRPVDEKALAIILVVLYEFVALMLLNGAMFWFLRRFMQTTLFLSSGAGILTAKWFAGKMPTLCLHHPLPRHISPRCPYRRHLHRKRRLPRQHTHLPLPCSKRPWQRRKHPRPCRRAFNFAKTVASVFWRTASSAAAAAHRSYPTQRSKPGKSHEINTAGRRLPAAAEWCCARAFGSFF